MLKGGTGAGEGPCAILSAHAGLVVPPARTWSGMTRLGPSWPNKPIPILVTSDQDARGAGAESGMTNSQIDTFAAAQHEARKLDSLVTARRVWIAPLGAAVGMRYPEPMMAALNG